MFVHTQTIKNLETESYELTPITITKYKQQESHENIIINSNSTDKSIFKQKTKIINNIDNQTNTTNKRKSECSTENNNRKIKITGNNKEKQKQDQNKRKYEYKISSFNKIKRQKNDHNSSNKQPENYKICQQNKNKIKNPKITLTDVMVKIHKQQTKNALNIAK